MPAPVSSYRLKQFQSARDPELAAALLLYVRNTSPPIRTDSNEIAYWLENFATSFGDEFYVFGFFRDNELVGYAQGAYFHAERLLVLDYLVIEEAQRKNNVFFEFVDHLKRFLETAHPEYRYAIVEVCYGPGQKYPSQESCLLTRLLKIQGFRVIRAKYYQPRLMLDDPESEMRADLLVYSTSDLESIHSETYLSIVHTIYYKYYLPWQSITKDSPDEYKKHLDLLYSGIKSDIGKKTSIVVNGHKAILSAPERKPAMTFHPVTVFSLQALGVIVLLAAVMVGLKFAFNLSDGSLVLIFSLALASFLAVASILSKNARAVFAQLVMLAKHIIRKGAVAGPFSAGDTPKASRRANKSGKGS